MIIAPLTPDQFSTAIALVREVYDKFVAPDYPPHGNETFYTFLAEDSFRERYQEGNLFLMVWVDDEAVGIIEIRDRSHISLFYVKQDYHGRKIGRALFSYTLDIIKTEYPEVEEITVKSSPYAVKIYEKLGFKRESGMQESHGIIYMPMVYKL